MTEWREMALGNVCNFVNGDRSSNYPKTADFQSNGLPFVSAADIGDGGIDFRNVNRITPAAFERLRSGNYRNGDIVFCLRGSLGKKVLISAEMEPGAIASSLVILRPNERVEPAYLNYQLESENMEGLVTSLDNGSVQPNISARSLARIPIPVPPLPEQRAIAGVLGALDDRIAANRRMAAVLESMARAIFTDWFVDFGPTRARMAGALPWLAPEIWNLFPDRLNPATGLPEGWEMKPLRSVFDLTMGQSPPGHTYNDDGDGLPFFQGRTDFGERFPSNRKYCSSPTRLAEAGDTLVSVRAPVGDINSALERCCIGRGVAALRHESGSAGYTYYFTASIQSQIQQYEHTGTVFGSITRKQFGDLSVMEPSSRLIEAFTNLISPLDDRICNSFVEARSLARMRDLLLTPLMSGRLRVATAPHPPENDDGYKPDQVP